MLSMLCSCRGPMRLTQGLAFHVNRLVDNRFADMLVLLAALAESVAIVMFQRPNMSTLQATYANAVHGVLRWVFSGELVLRLVGKGLAFSPDSLLRSFWGWLDFLGAITMWIDEVFPFANLSFLRLIYLLKVLQKVQWKFLRPLQQLSETVIRSMPQVIAVIISAIAVTTLFASIGLDIFGSGEAMFGRCGFSATGYASVPDLGCSSILSNSTCPVQQTCLSISPPEAHSFCVWGKSATQIVEVLFRDSWVSTLVKVMEVTHPAIVVVYVVLIVVGSLLLLNLTVAITVSAYGDVKRGSPEANAKASLDEGIDDQVGSGMVSVEVEKRKVSNDPIDALEGDDKLAVAALKAEPFSGMRWIVVIMSALASALSSAWGCLYMSCGCLCMICAGKKKSESAGEESGESSKRDRNKLPAAKRFANACTKCVFFPLGPEAQIMVESMEGNGKMAGKQLFSKPAHSDKDATEENDDEPISDPLWRGWGKPWDVATGISALLYAIVLALHQPEMSTVKSDALKWSSVSYMCLLLIRLLVLYVAHQGLAAFVLRRANFVDISVTACLCIGVISADLVGISQSAVEIWFLRLFRIAPMIWWTRILKIPKIFKRALGSVNTILSATVMAMFCVIIFTILAREMFRHSVFVGTPSMNSFTSATTVLLAILLGNGWGANAERAQDAIGAPGYIFFVVYQLVSNFVFLRLFIAIVVDNLELNDKQRLAGQKLLLKKQLETEHELQANNFSLEAKKKEFDMNVQFNLLKSGQEISVDELDEYNQKMRQMRAEFVLSSPPEESLSSNITIAPRDSHLANADAPGGPSRQVEIPFLQKIRLAIVNMFQTSNWLNGTIILFVLASTVLAVLNSPTRVIVDEDLMRIFDIVFLVVFALEALFKIFAFGRHPFSEEGAVPGYFRDGWNCFDFLIVIFQTLDFIESETGALFGGPSGDWLKGIRGLRAVRLLPRLKEMFKPPGGGKNSLALAWAAITSSLDEIGVVISSLFLWCCSFALIGMAVFMNALGSCSSPSNAKADCYGQHLHFPDEFPAGTALLVPNVWTVPNMNFDSFSVSLMTLIKVLNRAGTAELLKNLQAITGEESAPKLDNFAINATFVVIFQLVGGILVSQMVIGIMVNNLRLTTGVGLYTSKQRHWNATKLIISTLGDPVQVRKVADNTQLEPGLPAIKAQLTKLVQTKMFDYFCAAVVILHIGMYAGRRCSESQSYADAVLYTSIICCGWYAFEFFARLLTNWPDVDKSIFVDLFIAAVAALAIALEKMVDLHVGIASLVLLRLHRLFARRPTYQKIYLASQKAGPIVLSASFLLALWVFVFAVVGMQSFARVKSSPQLINEKNFSSFSRAMFLLFQVAIGEGWNTVMDDLGIRPPLCTSADSGNLDTDCGSAGAWVYILVYVIGANYFLFPLFLAAIIAGFYDASTQEESLVKNYDLQVYREVFGKYCVKSSSGAQSKEMSLNQLNFFLNAMKRSVLGKIKNKEQFLADAHEIAASNDGSDTWRTTGETTGRTTNRSARDPEDLRIHYRKLILLMCAHAFNPEPITIADILLREKADDVFAVLARRKQPRDLGPPNLRATMGARPILDSGIDPANNEITEFSFHYMQVLDDMVELGFLTEEQAYCAEDLYGYVQPLKLAEAEGLNGKQWIEQEFENYREEATMDSFEHVADVIKLVVKAGKQIPDSELTANEGTKRQRRRITHSKKEIAAAELASGAHSKTAPAEASALELPSKTLADMQKSLTDDSVDQHISNSLKNAKSMYQSVVQLGGGVIQRWSKEPSQGESSQQVQGSPQRPSAQLSRTLPTGNDWKHQRVSIRNETGQEQQIELSSWVECPHCGSPANPDWGVCPSIGCGRPLVGNMQSKPTAPPPAQGNSPKSASVLDSFTAQILPGTRVKPYINSDGPRASNSAASTSDSEQHKQSSSSAGTHVMGFFNTLKSAAFPTETSNTAEKSWIPFSNRDNSTSDSLIQQEKGATLTENPEISASKPSPAHSSSQPQQSMMWLSAAACFPQQPERKQQPSSAPNKAQLAGQSSANVPISSQFGAV